MAEHPHLHAAREALDRLAGLLDGEPSHDGDPADPAETADRADQAVSAVVTVVRGCLRALDALAADPSLADEQRARLASATDACARALEADEQPPEASQ